LIGTLTDPKQHPYTHPTAGDPGRADQPGALYIEKTASVLGTAAVLPTTLGGNRGSLPIAAGGGAGRRSAKNAGTPLNLEYR
jgi:hypothetical protein